MPRVRLRIRHEAIRDDLRLRYTEPKRPGEVFEFPLLRLVTTERHRRTPVAPLAETLTIRVFVSPASYWEVAIKVCTKKHTRTVPFPARRSPASGDAARTWRGSVRRNPSAHLGLPASHVLPPPATSAKLDRRHLLALSHRTTA